MDTDRPGRGRDGSLPVSPDVISLGTDDESDVPGENAQEVFVPASVQRFVVCAIDL